MVQMNVARLVALGQPLEVGTAEKPVPGARDVLVRVAACGLVPNTANIVGGHTPLIVPQLPAIFGLDVSGTIEAVGEQVVGLNEGDRVYINPLLSCETCHHCRRDRPDLCPSGALRGYMTWTPGGLRLLNSHQGGGMAEYVLAPHNKIVRLPDSIDLLTAARFGYIGTSFSALRKGGMGPGKTLLINGVTGTLGVAAVAIALGMGASCILGIGRNQEVLDRVKALAPERVETISSTTDNVVDWVLKQTNGLGVDVFYDCLGVGSDSEGTNALLRAVKDGGDAVLVAGGVHGDVSQPYFKILIHDVRVSGSNWFSNADIDQLVAMVGGGLIDFSFLEHRRFPLKAVNEAITLAGSRLGGFVNVVIDPWAD